MPLYEYQCQACGRRFELIRRHSEQDVERCPHCDQGPVTRLQSAPAIQFKGSGWYITDYARQGGEKGEKGEKAGDKTPDATAANSSGAKQESGGDGPTKSQPAAPAAPSSGGTPSKD